VAGSFSVIRQRVAAAFRVAVAILVAVIDAITGLFGDTLGLQFKFDSREHKRTTKVNQPATVWEKTQYLSANFPSYLNARGRLRTDANRCHILTAG
jgi:hypothetical protein